MAEQFSKSAQPLVPERLFVVGGKDGDGKPGELGNVSLLNQLIALLLSEKSGINLTSKPEDMAGLEKFTEELTKRLNQPGVEVAAQGGART